MLSNFEIEGCLAAKRRFLKVGSETAVGTLVGRLVEVKIGVKTGQNEVPWRVPGGSPAGPQSSPEGLWTLPKEAGRRQRLSGPILIVFFRNFTVFGGRLGKPKPNQKQKKTIKNR